MKMKCLNKTCGYEGSFSDDYSQDIKCPSCGSVMVSVTKKEQLGEVEKHMMDAIRWYGMEFVFTEMDKIPNPIHRCAHRKVFRELLNKMGLKWRPDFVKETTKWE